MLNPQFLTVYGTRLADASTLASIQKTSWRTESEQICHPHACHQFDEVTERAPIDGIWHRHELRARTNRSGSIPEACFPISLFPTPIGFRKKEEEGEPLTVNSSRLAGFFYLLACNFSNTLLIISAQTPILG